MAAWSCAWLTVNGEVVFRPKSRSKTLISLFLASEASYRPEKDIWRNEFRRRSFLYPLWGGVNLQKRAVRQKKLQFFVDSFFFAGAPWWRTGRFFDRFFFGWKKNRPICFFLADLFFSWNVFQRKFVRPEFFAKSFSDVRRRKEH